MRARHWLIGIVIATLMVFGTSCGGGGTGGGGGGNGTFTDSLNSGSPAMEDGSRYQEIAFRGLAPGTAEITVASSAFDAFVTVERVNLDGTSEVIAEDDDGGGGSGGGMNAAVSVVVTVGTHYKAIVTGTESNASGNFTGTYPATLLDRE